MKVVLLCLCTIFLPIFLFFSCTFKFEPRNKLFLISAVIDRSVKPRIDLAGGWKVAAEGSPFSLNCSVQLKIESSVFLNWKYPNEDVKNVSIQIFSSNSFYGSSSLNSNLNR